MNKGIILCAAILIVLFSTSCKRRHHCYCRYSGTADEVLIREYRGYSKKEARKLCESEEYAANSTLLVDCDIR